MAAENPFVAGTGGLVIPLVLILIVIAVTLDMGLYFSSLLGSVAFAYVVALGIHALWLEGHPDDQ